MNGAQRRRELLKLIKDNGGASVGEIADKFPVSKMTIHRDLQLMEGEGIIRRVFGGAVPAQERSEHAEHAPQQLQPLELQTCCFICHRQAPQNLFYTLTLENGEQRTTCCPHCGLLAHLMLGDQVRMAMATDFITGRPHPAQRSHFLVNSAAAPCCHPSALAFEAEDMALRFQKGFSGTMAGFDETLEFMKQEMTLSDGKKVCPNCSEGGG